MNWDEIRLDSDTASSMFDDYKASGDFQCPDEFMEIRNDITQCFVTVLSEMGIGPEQIAKKNNAYLVDYQFGLKLYSLLNKKYGMTARNASSADVWRFLSIRVVPDVVDMRYGTDHPDRFWKKAKRIWLRVLWWYIYLSWQGSEELTAEVLEGNSTDEILQLVDRCGRGGYRVETYRELMKQHAQLDPAERRKKQIFRRVMVLNTARVQVIEPGLVCGGEEKYISGLIEYFN